MKLIDKNSKIFKSKEFIKDIYKFYLIPLNLQSEEVVLYSDEENYVVCRGKVGLPTWIWTKDNIAIDTVREIEEVINLYLTDTEKDKFTCKKELYDLLVQDNFTKINRKDYFEMGFLYCNKTKKPKDCEGKMDIPTIKDKPILVKYLYDDYAELNDCEAISMKDAEIKFQSLIDSKKYYVWRNDNNKIVCTINYNEVNGSAKVGGVYTPPEERGKGYAANLVYSLTNILLEKGLEPLLYTDYNYIPSNKAYLNAGYIDAGILINFSCSKEKVRK